MSLNQSNKNQLVILKRYKAQRICSFDSFIMSSSSSYSSSSTNYPFCDQCKGYLPHCYYQDRVFYRCRYCNVEVANTGGFRLAKHERKCPRTPRGPRCFCLQPMPYGLQYQPVTSIIKTKALLRATYKLSNYSLFVLGWFMALPSQQKSKKSLSIFLNLPFNKSPTKITLFIFQTAKSPTPK